MGKMLVPLGIVPLIINPIYTLYSGYLLGISPFKGLLGGLNRGYHPKGTSIFPMTYMDPSWENDGFSKLRLWLKEFVEFGVSMS